MKLDKIINENNAGKLLLVSSFLIMISIFMPFLLTRESCCGAFDFSKTGQIGDTIGGIISPMVSIVGVFLTFCAFYMQVKANSIQKDQMLKSLRMPYLEDKTQSYYKLQLLEHLISGVIKDISANVESIEKCMEKYTKDHFSDLTLYRTPIMMYDRFLSQDQLEVYKCFYYFMSDDSSMSEKFEKMYSCVDYVSVGLKEIYRIMDDHGIDIFKDKIKVKELLEEMDALCVKINNNKLCNTSECATLRRWKNTYEKIVLEQNDSTAYLYDVLVGFRKEIIEHLCKSPNEHFEKIESMIGKVLIILNEIPRKNTQVIGSLRFFRNNLKNNGEKSIEKNLHIISEYIGKAVRENSREKIKEEVLSAKDVFELEY